MNISSAILFFFGRNSFLAFTASYEDLAEKLSKLIVIFVLHRICFFDACSALWWWPLCSSWLQKALQVANGTLAEQNYSSCQ